jgi:hypothetical protein
MPKFHVHAYLTVRAKIVNVEADDHRGAIAAVEADPSIIRGIARLIHYDKGGERIPEIEFAEEMTSFLVDVVHDDSHDESIGFDYTPPNSANLVEIGREPGRNVPINRFVRTAIEAYDLGEYSEALAVSQDIYDLKRNMSQHDDPLPIFIAGELAALPDYNKAEAIGRINAAIEDLIEVRDALEILPETQNVPARSVKIVHDDYDSIRASVLVDGIGIGTLDRERFKGGIWRDAVLYLNDGRIMRGLQSAAKHLYETYQVPPEIALQTHPDYFTIYDSEGVPFSRIMIVDGSYRVRELASGRSQAFDNFDDALADARAPQIQAVTTA